MSARRLPNENVLISLPGVGPAGEIAEGLIEIGPEQELYAVWDAHLRGLGE